MRLSLQIYHGCPILLRLNGFCQQSVKIASVVAELTGTYGK